MFINPIIFNPQAAATGKTANSPSTPTTSTTDATGDLFLTILVAELKSQDPTSPLDPNQMVGQMMSMNQLNELIQIRQLLQGQPPAAQSGNNPTTGAI